MAQDLNSVTLVGNLTRDPELRHLQSGTPVAKLRIAVNDRVKRQGDWTDAAYFFDVTVWGRMAESCAEYLAKGRKVGVQGKLTWREWEANDGSKRQAVEVVAANVQFLTPRGENGGYGGGGGDYGYAPPGDDFGVPGGNEPEPAAAASDAAVPDFAPANADDDIPF